LIICYCVKRKAKDNFHTAAILSFYCTEDIKSYIFFEYLVLPYTQEWSNLLHVRGAYDDFYQFGSCQQTLIWWRRYSGTNSPCTDTSVACWVCHATNNVTLYLIYSIKSYQLISPLSQGTPHAECELQFANICYIIAGHRNG
jgi:hypothetical protein